MKLHELKAKRDELWVIPKPCVICLKVIPGPYGRHMSDENEIWTCSLEHERSYYASISKQSSPR